jgi:hypothetical protein
MIRRTNSDKKEKKWLRFNLQMLWTEKIKNIFISLNFWVRKKWSQLLFNEKLLQIKSYLTHQSHKSRNKIVFRLKEKTKRQDKKLADFHKLNIWNQVVSFSLSAQVSLMRFVNGLAYCIKYFDLIYNLSLLIWLF